MKPSLESVHSPGLHHFLVRRFEEQQFSAPYHFHPEFELTYILKGSGKRYVGTHMSDFEPGDFVLLGSNLPHCWKTGDAEPGKKSGSLVAQFLPDFAGEDFFMKPAMVALKQLLEKSSNGIQFTGERGFYEKKMLELLDNQNSFKKLLLLLDLLHFLSQSDQYILLEKQNSHGQLSSVEQERIHVVMAYLVENFKSPVTVTKAASLANMTVPAFCKYFKKITRKTFVEAVTDYRIDFAAQQLIHTSDSISQIASDSGFNDLSHFHKLFKGKLGLSPLVYRKGFLK